MRDPDTCESTPQDASKTKCKKGTHQLTPLNTEIYIRKDGTVVRRCITCRDARRGAWLRKRHRPQPSETGVCGKGLHKWIPENKTADGTRCKLCRLKYQRVRYHRTKVLIGRRVRRSHYNPCLAKPRSSTSENENYICPRHRVEPPDWIKALGLHIRGTQVVP